MRKELGIWFITDNGNYTTWGGSFERAEDVLSDMKSDGDFDSMDLSLIYFDGTYDIDEILALR